MEKKDLRIVYMGTPEFAVEPLKQLIDASYNVVAVITMPDKPAGRGYKLQASAVKQYALSKDIPVLQPVKLKDPDFLAELKAYKADIQVVVAFRMLPELVWNMPTMGTFNLHASLLPQYRGAAPINWAIINGDEETGVSTFFLTHEIDTGDIILQDKVAIGPEDNAGDLHDTLMLKGANLVVETLDNILSEDPILPLPQVKNGVLKSAPKIFKETCRIDWTQDIQQIKNLVRGMSPYPAAFTQATTEKGKELGLKIYTVSIEACEHDYPMGSLISDNKTYLKFAAKDGFVNVHHLQLAGKKAMSTQELLRGCNFITKN